MAFTFPNKNRRVSAVSDFSRQAVKTSCSTVFKDGNNKVQFV